MTRQKKSSTDERPVKRSAGARSASRGAAQLVSHRASARLKLGPGVKSTGGLPALPELFLEEVQRHLVLTPKAMRLLKESFRDLYERQMHEGDGQPSPVESVVPTGDRILTTQQAADLVGVSRPFMAARIDAGDVPLFQQIGNQRRVLASQVQAWHERSGAKRREVLRALASSTDEEYPDED